MTRLRRVDCSGPGIRRVARGRGFSYLAPDGDRLTDAEALDRIDALVIPPAWRDVWICPLPNGHIQATGTDAAGRRQYRYHDAWRIARDREKHERMIAFAQALPAARAQIAVDLARPEIDRTRVLAAALRLLDLGFFRIGSEEYAETNESYGLATMLREHVTCESGVVTFDYTAKGGKQRIQSVADDDVCELVTTLKRRRGGGQDLLAFRAGRAWRDVKSHDINEYLQQVVGPDFSAKDFRTWHATVLCAVSLAVVSIGGHTEAGRKRAVSFAVKETAHYLGNTPAVCRASYIDPRVIDRYNDGLTIADALDQLGADAEFGQPATQGPIEEAVLDLLREPPAGRRSKRAACLATTVEFVLRVVFRVVRQRKWWWLHVFVVVAVAVMLRLGLWQWDRATSPTGGLQNYAYAFQWPLFAVFAVVLWWKTMRDEARRSSGAPVSGEQRRPMPDQPVMIDEYDGVRRGIVTQMPAVDESDREVATYNAYLARLNARSAPSGR